MTTTLVRDLRLGTRLALKRPGQTAIALLALGLGIGLSTGMYCIVHGTYQRPLPFEDAERIFRISWRSAASGPADLPLTIPDYLLWREQKSSFEDLAGWYGTSVNVSGGDLPPARYNGCHVAANMFQLLRVGAALGRTLEPPDARPEAPPVVVIGDLMWRRRFHSDPQAVGRTLVVNGLERTVIGVMPKGFGFPLSQELWLPMRIDSSAVEQYRQLPIQIFGKLREGFSPTAAEAELTAVTSRLASEDPATANGKKVVLSPYVQAYTKQSTRSFFYAMFTGVLLLLMIACGNVANLLLARMPARSREIAIRTALGAGRLRIITQILTENLIFTVGGAILGLWFTKLVVDAYILTQAASSTYTTFWLGPFWVDVRIDSAVYFFIIGLVALVTVITVIPSAFQTCRANCSEALAAQARSSATRQQRFLNKALVTFQFTLCCTLLVATGLMYKTVRQITSFDFGFAANNIFTCQLSIADDYEGPEEQMTFLDDLTIRLNNLPGVQGVAFSTALPAKPASAIPFAVEGSAYDSVDAYPPTKWVKITADFFSTYATDLREGRSFTSADRADSEPVVIVNESLAARYFPAESPLGRRIRLGRPEQGLPWMRIVGVAPDMGMGGIGDSERQGIFLPLRQRPQGWVTLSMRTGPPPLELTRRVAEEVAALNPNLPIFWVESFEEALAADSHLERMMLKILMISGFMALFLAAIGLFGVMAFAVSNREHEIGLRMALGARATDVLRLIFKEGVAQIALGTILGLSAAAFLVRFLTAYLFEVKPWDIGVFATVTGILTIAGLLACWVPVRRATRVDPMAVLRCE